MMHDAAFGWLSDVAATLDRPDAALPVAPVQYEVGGPWVALSTLRGIDVGAGGAHGEKARRLFDPTMWQTVDWNPDTEPDVVADMTIMVLPTELPSQGYDLVLCTEVLEHVPAWRSLLFNCIRLVGPGGHLLVTCAGTGREPHSAVDGGPLREDEHYANIDPHELAGHLLQHVIPYGLVLRQFVYDPGPADIYLHVEVQRDNP